MNAELNNVELWSLIVGFFLPLAISVVQQQRWGSGFRAVVGFVVCLVAAAGTVFFTHGLHVDEHLVKSALLVIVTAQATYSNLWKPTGVSPSVEAATTPNSTR